MSTLTRWDPFRELSDCSSRLSAFLNRAPVKEGESDNWFAQAAWAPLVDITEDDSEYLIKAELPEVKKDAVKVTVENGVLRLTGERQSEKEEKNKKYHRVERSYGSFVRSFVLPDDSDASKVSAEFNEGVLRVHLPKAEQAKPRQVDIKVS
jgi:HSP20 family protein